MWRAMQVLRTIRWTIVGLLLVPWLWLSSADAAPPRARPTVQEVLQTWKARQNRVKAARFEWTRLDTMTSAMYPDLPKDGVTHKLACSLSMGGGMLRHSTRGLAWSEGSTPTSTVSLAIARTACRSWAVGRKTAPSPPDRSAASALARRLKSSAPEVVRPLSRARSG